MKLAEAKRRVVEGMTLHAVGHMRPEAGGPRTVTRVQTNGFWFDTERHRNAWLEWPSAREIAPGGPNELVLLRDGELMTTLTFPELETTR